MLVKILAVLESAATLLTVLCTELLHKGWNLLWIVPLTFAAWYLLINVLYVLILFIGTELTVKLDKEQETPSPLWSRVLETTAEYLCTYGRIRIHLTGMEKLPEGRFLMACNHRSSFDPIVKIPIFKEYGLKYISKPSNFRIPVGGKLMHAYGCLSMNRENNREALKTVQRASAMIDSDSASVCIYPEGTRNTKDELLPFHAGSFKIAQRSKVPVVVTTVRGTDLVQKNFPFRHTDVYIDVTGVIDAEFASTHKTQETAEKAREMIQKKFNELKESQNA